jgi:oxygen-independent coproporphyrinogen-3 oxidase
LLDKSLNVIDDYLAALKKEIVQSVEFINAHGKLLSVYVGGGTPTAISAEQIFKLFDGFDFSNVEFTIEAGRPDTITKEKLDVIKSVGASRICVNPQSLNDSTLKAIGRSHSAQDFYEKYSLASLYDFDINVDLIAGLANETLDDFKNTLIKTIELSPDNVTVHTLSRKNGSNLKLTGASYTNDEIELMTNFARNKLGENGYIPYYLYRQKQMLGNLENVGYCKSGKQCVNNISTMEEFNSVIACGAGAISKIVQGYPSKIERFANMRDVKLYLERFDERLDAKEKFLLENLKK